MNKLDRDLKSRIHDAVQTAISDGLAAFATAGADALAALQPVHNERARKGPDEIADAFATIFTRSIVCEIAAEVDAHPIDLGDGVTVRTRLADFASGVGVPSPIEEVSAEHTYPIPLRAVPISHGSLDTSGLVTVRAACSVDSAQQPVVTTGATLTLRIAWSSQAKT
jgi:hypothetical protein